MKKTKKTEQQKKIKLGNKNIHNFRNGMRKIEYPDLKDLKIPKINIGIELECIYNKDFGDEIEVGAYHKPIPFSQYWRTERDGSLYNRGAFEDYQAIEFTTDVIPIDEYKNVVDDLRKHLIGDSNRELYEVLNFNESCGCHFHFSIKGGGLSNNFSKNIPTMVYPIVRNYFFELLDESKIIYEDTKEGIKKHYFRPYAKKFKRSDLRNNSRYLEFNFISESVGMGLEWRSFNVLGVEYWDELKEMFRIATDTIKYFASMLSGYTYTDKKTYKKGLNEISEEIGLNNGIKKKYEEEIFNKEIEKDLTEKEIICKNGINYWRGLANV